ncbi:MAG: trimethylamine N-oxide reductase system protein TorE [Gammaproteobacteria bacterium]|nr:trimethylamine N-oxide reductase system protein TorE [Gammaproteobacteria bacterium]
MAKLTSSGEAKKIKGDELKALGFIIVVLFPMLSIFSIGAYGFIIWMIQAFGGSVGH